MNVLYNEWLSKESENLCYSLLKARDAHCSDYMVLMAVFCQAEGAGGGVDGDL